MSGPFNGVTSVEWQREQSVTNPSHYRKHPSGVECITVTEHFNFNRGNAIKYVWRAGEKCSELDDLKKARWYLDREIARLEKSKPATTVTIHFEGASFEAIGPKPKRKAKS